MTTCSILDCGRPTVALGYCSRHYQRLKTYGDPQYTTRNPPGTFATCTIPGCGNKPLCKGLCNKHYTRQYKYGDPNAAAFIRSDVGAPEKWVREVALAFDAEECLPYPFALAQGYGQIWIDGKKFSAHRYVCERVNGPPPTRRHAAAHECGNAQCVNPRHLAWKTYKENEADKLRHGTHQRGERSFQAKLTEDQVRAIRAAPGRHADIAANYGVSRRAISMIKTRGSWGWLP